MASVLASVGDGVKTLLRLRQHPLSPPLRRRQLSSIIFLVLIDYYVSYTPLSMSQYSNYKKGMINVAKEWQKNAMERHDGTNNPPMITAVSHVASGLMSALVARAQPKLTSAGPAIWHNA